MVIATVEETGRIQHRIIIPPQYPEATLSEIAPSGSYTVEDIIATLVLPDGKQQKLTMLQKWPIRLPRPVASRLALKQPLVTGLRVIDTLFPLAKGGTVAIPGGFGTGKTMTQHSIAQWCDADIIVYIGCGERGNEMTDVLREFPLLVDPRTGQSLMERTILIANTSNMPVSAREASIYTGITMAEYYRDQGYHVLLWQTQPAVGLKHYVSLVVVWKRCRLKKVSQPTYQPVSLSSMNGQVLCEIFREVRGLSPSLER